MVLDFGLFSGSFSHQNNLCRNGADLPASTVSCETSEQPRYSSTSVLVKLTYTGDMQEKEEDRQRPEKTRQSRERESKERQGKIKSNLYSYG